MRAPSYKENCCGDGLITMSEREDFSDYLWMEDVESFDKQVLAELQEEEEMEQCMEEMLAEEEARDTTYYYVEGQNPALTLMPYPNFLNIIHDDIGMLMSMATLGFYDDGVLVVESQLNPDAEEFVPNALSTSSSSSSSSSDMPKGPSENLDR